MCNAYICAAYMHVCESQHACGSQKIMPGVGLGLPSCLRWGSLLFTVVLGFFCSDKDHDQKQFGA